jgi:predicted esterase YcpF (UPF0227 family)
MATLIYLHGFNSSPQSHKAQVLARDLEERGLSGSFFCPALPTLASDAVALAEDIMARRSPGTLRPLCFVGSSLGGYYATWLAEEHDARAVPINPAVTPHQGLNDRLGPQENMYTGERWELTPAHVEAWARLWRPVIDPKRYLLLVETGDEVLDYRAAVERYHGARQVVVQGGDHTFQSFPQYIPALLEFAGFA